MDKISKHADYYDDKEADDNGEIDSYTGDKLSKHTYYHYKGADDTGDANIFLCWASDMTMKLREIMMTMIMIFRY